MAGNNEHVQEVGLRFTADGAAEYVRSLKEINAEMGQTYAEYQRETAMLSENATATEKLAAKKQYLAQQVDLQKEKVTALKGELDAMTQSEDADTVAISKKQKELAQAEAKLANYEKGLKSTTDELKNHSEWTDKASTALQNFGGKLEDAGKKASIASASVVAAGTASVKAAGDFQEGINKINTLDISAAPEKIQGIKDDILSLSTETGVAATDLAESTYQMGSALGEQKDNTVAYVGVATKAAVGGFTDTSTAVNGLTTVMNTYGMTTVEEMQKVSDQMLMAQNLGKTSFGEIAQSVGNVIPIFKTAGGSTEDLFAAYAILTKNGIATAQATTGLKAALSNIIKPTADAAAMAEELGIDFTMAHMQNVGFSAFLNEIAVACDGDADKMAKLFGSTEALNTMLTLTSSEGIAQYNDAVVAMGDATGSTEAAFEKMHSGVNAQTETLKTSITNLAISFGEILLPAITQLIGWIQGIITSLSSMDDGTKQTIVTIGLVVAAIGPALIILGKLTTSIGSIIAFVPKITSAFSTISKAFTGFTSLIAAHPIVAAITAVIAIIATLWTKCEWFRNLVYALWDGIKATFQALVSWLKTAFESVKNALTKLWEGIKSIVDKIVDVFKSWIDYVKSVFVAGWTAAVGTVKGVFSSLFDSISAIWEDIKGIFSGIIDFVKNVFAGNWSAAWNSIVSVFGHIFSGLANFVKAPINAVISLLNGAINGINKISVKVPDWVPGLGGKTLGFNIPVIPMLAKGGELLSGMAVVAEAGPELLSNSGGITRVTPLTSNGNNSAQIGLTDESIAKLVAALIRALRDADLLKVILSIDDREFARLVRDIL